MRVARLHFRRRCWALHWPSKDHRDYRTAGRLAARRTARASDAPAAEPRRAGSQLPELSAIVSMRRDGAWLQVEFGVAAASAASSTVLAVNGAGSPPARRMSASSHGSSEGRTRTLTLPLN